MVLSPHSPDLITQSVWHYMKRQQELGTSTTMKNLWFVLHDVRNNLSAMSLCASISSIENWCCFESKGQQKKVVTLNTDVIKMCVIHFLKFITITYHRFYLWQFTKFTAFYSTKKIKPQYCIHIEAQRADSWRLLDVGIIMWQWALIKLIITNTILIMITMTHITWFLSISKSSLLINRYIVWMWSKTCA